MKNRLSVMTKHAFTTTLDNGTALGIPLVKSFESRFWQAAVADALKRRSLLRYFCSKYCCYQYFNGL